MRGQLWLAMICVASYGAAAHAQGQQGYPGGYGGLGAYGGYGWSSGPGGFSPNMGFGTGINSNAIGPYSNSGPFAPNQFNRSNQPLSPYLNMQKNGNPAVNYYYRVRPGTVPNTSGSMGSQGMGMGGQRPPFFQEQYGPDPLADADSPGRLLPPAGHPVVFSNTLGYFPTAGMGGRGMRPGMLGVGSQGQGQGGGGSGRPMPKR